MIDVDAIPLDLLPQHPVATLYLATVEALPNDRVKVVPHYGEPVWQWFGKPGSAPAHGPLLGCRTTPQGTFRDTA